MSGPRVFTRTRTEYTYWDMVYRQSEVIKFKLNPHYINLEVL
jgi:hypothetical protein